MNILSGISEANPLRVRRISLGFFGAMIGGLLLASCASYMTSSVTVAEALAAPDGKQVVVTGEVIQQLDSENILLRDSTGNINVRFNKEMVGKMKFAPDSRLRISGKMDRNRERSILLAKSIEVVH